MMHTIYKKYRFLFLLFYFLYLLYPWDCRAFEHDIKGQVYGWMSGNQGKELISRAGLRYIPDVFIEKMLNENLLVDAEISLNTYVNGNFND